MTKQEKIKEGTILIATDVCKMSGCDEEVLTIDKEYRVISVDYEKREFVIIDDELSEHYFDIEDYAGFFKLHNNGWIKIEDQLPPDGEEVLFFNEKWICEDFNPFGTRIGFLNNEDYVSAHYWSYQDSYETIAHWICDDSNEFSEEIKNSIDPTHWKLINGKPPIY